MYPNTMGRKKRIENMENQEDQNLEEESIQIPQDNTHNDVEMTQYNSTTNFYPHSTYGNEPNTYYETSFPSMYQNTSTYNYDTNYSVNNPNEYSFSNFPQHFYHTDNENTFYEDSTNKDGRGPVSLRFIEGKTRRGVTFSKRKKGLMKKAYELSVLTGSEVLVLVASEGGNVFSFATDRFKKIIENHQSLIKECLQNSPFVAEDKENQIGNENSNYEEDAE